MVMGAAAAAPSGNGEIGKQRTQQVQDGEGVEGAGKPEVLGCARRYQTADEIARYIARDVGGECGGSIGRRVALAEMRQCQAERGCHAHALHDAQRGEYGEVRRVCKKRGGDGEESQTDDNAGAAIDVAAEQSNREARCRHAEGAGVDG